MDRGGEGGVESEGGRAMTSRIHTCSACKSDYEMWDDCDCAVELCVHSAKHLKSQLKTSISIR